VHGAQGRRTTDTEPFADFRSLIFDCLAIDDLRFAIGIGDGRWPIAACRLVLGDFRSLPVAFVGSNRHHSQNQESRIKITNRKSPITKQSNIKNQKSEIVRSGSAAAP
jgi:hypothetical protein